MLAAAPRLIAIPPAVWPLPYSLVRFEPAGAQVHLVVSLLGFTPGSLVVLAGAEQPLNLPPPSLVFDSELAEAVVGADVEELAACWELALFSSPLLLPLSFPFPCAVAAGAGAEVAAPVLELDDDDALTDWSCFACPGGVPCGPPAQAREPVSALISTARATAPRARLFIAPVSFRGPKRMTDD